MIPVLSLVTSIKDYLEVVHKLIEYDSSSSIINYSELGTIITYFIISIKNGVIDFLSFSWLKNIWSLPIIIPDISSAMISEISVLDGYFHNAFNFLDTPISYGEQNIYLLGLEKFSIGVLNSLFLFLPTSTAHIITLRRFVMQGLSAGFISGLGTIAGNLLWLTSVILGWRFIVIPWLSLDIFRYLLGFMLLVKYMWDSYNERRTVLEDASKPGALGVQGAAVKMFLLTFLLSLTEQTSIYPFISNLSVSPEASIFEGFPAENSGQFLFIHLSYLLGIGVGSLSLLNLTCWFMENPAFKLYMWMISSFKVSTSVYYRVLSSVFLYLTMLSAISSIPYYGLDYTITNPLGYVNEDRLIQDKVVLETSFLGSKASDRNTRRNRGRHGRRERWKRRIRKYRTFDASLYDQGIYDLFTIEDLNYGFDRFWLRRKLRNHRVRFRFFPGPWMRSFKKQLAKPRLESYTGPRVEFFRILFEQVYHPSFHAYDIKKDKKGKNDSQTQKAGSSDATLLYNSIKGSSPMKFSSISNFNLSGQKQFSIYSPIEGNKTSPSGQNKKEGYLIKNDWRSQNSTLRKFVRKLDSRLKTAEIAAELNKGDLSNERTKVYSKRWKHIFSKLSREGVGRTLVNPSLYEKEQKGLSLNLSPAGVGLAEGDKGSMLFARKNLSKKDFQILRYRTLVNSGSDTLTNGNGTKGLSNLPAPQAATLLHPLKFYLQKQKGFERKLRYYTPSVFRKFSVENNAPYFRVMMRRYFYNYKATNRWERTMKAASLRKARRKTTRIPRKLSGPFSGQVGNSNSNINDVGPSAPLSMPSGGSVTTGSLGLAVGSESAVNANSVNNAVTILNNRLVKPTNNYSVVSKRASRYRYQIYKDVLQHWYYSPFNRLLMKFDVDSFIRRQPNSHFLTPKEENLLHLRRFLLSEHYNTLRWYTNMEHYRSMKTRINGTKSFSSQAYNQQFYGTFKKIRHLFAITPSQGNVVLKFDQPLYNEYPNTSSNPLLNPLIIHEELLTDSSTSDGLLSLVSGAFGPALKAAVDPVGPFGENLTTVGTRQGNEDLIEQSTKLVREYLNETRPARSEYIKELLNSNNYTTLTQFLYKGEKTRGTEPVTNNRSLNNQEKEILLTTSEKQQIDEMFNKEKIRSFIQNKSFMEDLYLSYLFKWKRRINDQESLKNYLTRRIDKREKRKQRKEKNLLAKLKLLQTRAIPGDINSNVLAASSKKEELYGDKISSEFLTSGLQKSILEGMYTSLNVDVKTTSKYEKSLWKVLLLSKIKNMNEVGNSNNKSTRLAPLALGTGALTLTKGTLDTVAQQKIQKEINISALQLTNVLQKIKQSNNTSRNLFLNPAKKGAKGQVKSLSVKVNRFYNLFKQTIPSYLGITKISNLLKPIKRKSLKNWRKKERALTKQKRLRKDFKLLNKKTELSFSKGEGALSNLDRNEMNLALISATSRKKRDLTSNNSDSQFYKLSQKDSSVQTAGLAATSESNGENKGSFLSFLGRDFKRKRSPQRRSRVRRNRGVFKKRTLNDTLKKDIRMFNSTANLTLEQKNAFYEKMNILLYQSNEKSRAPEGGSAASLGGLKQRKSKQRKQRYWKQKRSKYSQKRRKYRKRRRYALGKIRVLSKQLKRVKNKLLIQNWWWKKYMPSVQASTDALWQIEKDKFIQQKLSELSTAEILERDRLNSSSALQIGNKDFKPLSIPGAIPLSMSSVGNPENNIGNISSNSLNNSLSLQMDTNGSLIKNNTLSQSSLLSDTNQSSLSGGSFETVNKLYENLFINKKGSLLGAGDNSYNSSFNNFMVPNTNLPFYAGWDESLRKFVVTNRMLSRLDAGYEVKPGALPSATSLANATVVSDRNTSTGPKGQNDSRKGDIQSSVIAFDKAPLQGMNAATTLYWQIPFTTYDPDQFFALGMDGFSPIGWRKFAFRHSILKSWLDTIYSTNPASQVVSSTDNTGSSGSLVVKLRTENGASSPLSSSVPGGLSMMLALAAKKQPLLHSYGKEQGVDAADYAKSRRLKKRYRRVKKHPRTPVWFPSGPLLNQVLPVHYIYVFYKRSRLPRDRYLKRRLLNKTESEGFQKTLSSNPSIAGYDFTLRKRLKPKRKYHLKRDFYSKNLVIPRRFKFISSVGEDVMTPSFRTRPLSSKKINKPIAELVKEQKLMRTKQRRKELSSKQQTPMLRVKQLRRRVQRQILRSVWRYRPRAGGFVWPGDYLKFEPIKAPLLKENTGKTITDTSAGGAGISRKTKRKKKRNLVEWQIQPKKYLYQKHNLKVLKKKLEKAQNADKIAKIQELSYKF